ncbi:MAG: RNA-binding S4 domain-containing protein, partial [Muribaculaceae bacterium]|nr:RNA-binding S4 domain-containing protein [Muribaculaceae bacterium]
RVTMGGVTLKPSRTVKPGDIVEVKKPPITYTFRVVGIAPNRLGARFVPEYLENLTPQSQYDLLEMTKISGFVDRQKGLGRPTKRDSRELSRFKEESYADAFYLDWEDDGEEDD